MADPDYSAPEPTASTSVARWIIIGTLLRLGLSLISIGTNDVLTWQRFAQSARDVGLTESYRHMHDMNHPPLMVLWAQLALMIGGNKGFAFVFKLLAIASDAVAIAVLGRLSRAAAMAMALSPIAILISGYHGNTDSVYAMLSLLAMYFIAERRMFFVAGAVLALAINVKLTPVLLVPPALGLCRNKREFIHLMAGVALAAIPFLANFGAVHYIGHNVFAYQPQADRWGVGLFLHEPGENPAYRDLVFRLMAAYIKVGRWLILGSAIAIGAISWGLRRWNAYELGTLVYALFLILAPGFGLQYLVMIVPLMLAVSIPRAWVYGVLCGIFALCAYWIYLVAYDFPLLSMFQMVPLPMPGPLFGLLAWWVLIEVVVWIFRPPAKAGGPVGSL